MSCIIMSLYPPKMFFLYAMHRRRVLLAEVKLPALYLLPVRGYCFIVNFLKLRKQQLL